MMHSTWRCITHSCYITLARKFKTSGLGWKWWFNYYLWTTTTTGREKKGLQTLIFLFLKPAHLSHYSYFVPSSFPACVMVQQPSCHGDGLPARAGSGLGLRSPSSSGSSSGPFGHAVPLSSEGVPSFPAAPEAPTAERDALRLLAAAAHPCAWIFPPPKGERVPPAAP